MAIKKRITLKRYLLHHSQVEAAEAMGVVQSAISHMLRFDRDMVIRFYEDGSTDYYQIKKGRSAA